MTDNILCAVQYIITVHQKLFYAVLGNHITNCLIMRSSYTEVIFYSGIKSVTNI